MICLRLYSVSICTLRDCMQNSVFAGVVNNQTYFPNKSDVQELQEPEVLQFHKAFMLE